MMGTNITAAEIQVGRPIAAPAPATASGRLVGTVESVLPYGDRIAVGVRFPSGGVTTVYLAADAPVVVRDHGVYEP